MRQAKGKLKTMHWACELSEKSRLAEIMVVLVPSLPASPGSSKASALALRFACLNNLEPFNLTALRHPASCIVIFGLRGAFLGPWRDTQFPPRKHLPALSRLFLCFGSLSGAKMPWHRPC